MENADPLQAVDDIGVTEGVGFTVMLSVLTGPLQIAGLAVNSCTLIVYIPATGKSRTMKLSPRPPPRAIVVDGVIDQM